MQKMKLIRVYLQYPWKFLDSPYYKYLIQQPPKGIKYINAKQKLITQRGKFFILNKLKANIRKVVGFLNLPLLNSHLTKTKEKYELIHCAHCLSLNKEPWVADFEGVWQVFVSGKLTRALINKARNLLLNKNCKKIMPWTNEVKKEMLKIFPDKKIRDKIDVIYPAVPLQITKKIKKKGKKPTLLYAARYFWIKGGFIALETLKKLKEKYDIETIFISNTPSEIRKKYPEINFLDLMPHEKLFEYYKKADIFFYPSFIDTFGFALLEAMSFGLPIVTVNTKRTKSRNEIIENNKQGFVIDIKGLPNYYKMGKYEQEIVKKLVEKTSKLIENAGLRKKMSKNCISTIKNGKFSIKERNEKLRRIYEEVLK